MPQYSTAARELWAEGEQAHPGGHAPLPQGEAWLHRDDTACQSSTEIIWQREKVGWCTCTCMCTVMLWVKSTCTSSFLRDKHSCNYRTRGFSVDQLKGNNLKEANNYYWRKLFPLSWPTENPLVPSFWSQLRITVFSCKYRYSFGLAKSINFTYMYIFFYSTCTCTLYTCNSLFKIY